MNQQLILEETEKVKALVGEYPDFELMREFVGLFPPVAEKYIHNVKIWAKNNDHMITLIYLCYDKLEHLKESWERFNTLKGFL